MKEIHKSHIHRNLGSYRRDVYVDNARDRLRRAEMGGKVRNELCAEMPGLWCRTLGYYTKIFELLTGLCVSLSFDSIYI